MPNWCSNDTKIFSKKKSDIEKFKMVLDKGIKENPIENDFGPNWLGNLAYNVGLDYSDKSCRGEFSDTSFEVEKNEQLYYLSLSTETDWCSDHGFWTRILDKFNKDNNTEIKSVSLSVETGCDLFVNTDYDNLFFSEQYYLNIYSENDNIDIYDTYDTIDALVSSLNETFNTFGLVFKTTLSLEKIKEEIIEKLGDEATVILATFE